MSRALKIWLPSVRAGSGADVFTLRLAEALGKAGHTPVLQWFNHRYELMPWRLKTVVAPPGVDLVHAGSWQGFAFKRTGIPLVLTEHQYIAHPAFARYRSVSQALYHRLFVEGCVRRSYAKADAIVVVSEFCAAAMRNDMIKPVDVIHNWIDTERFVPRAQPMAASESGRAIRLLFVGNPARRKGSDLLPKLASMLGDGFEIHCLGGLRKAFSSDSAPGNMKLLPSVGPDDMADIYRSMDMALVPTRYEPFGYVALEAMACGLPVVGFDSSGTAEVCHHGETALLAPIDDVTQLVGYIRQLAMDPALRARLGVAGRQRAVSHFSETQAIGDYLDIYRDVTKLAVDG